MLFAIILFAFAQDLWAAPTNHVSSLETPGLVRVETRPESPPPDWSKSLLDVYLSYADSQHLAFSSMEWDLIRVFEARLLHQRREPIQHETYEQTRKSSFHISQYPQHVSDVYKSVYFDRNSVGSFESRETAVLPFSVHNLCVVFNEVPASPCVTPQQVADVLRPFLSKWAAPASVVFRQFEVKSQRGADQSNALKELIFFEIMKNFDTALGPIDFVSISELVLTTLKNSAGNQHLFVASFANYFVLKSREPNVVIAEMVSTFGRIGITITPATILNALITYESHDTTLIITKYICETYPSLYWSGLFAQSLEEIPKEKIEKLYMALLMSKRPNHPLSKRIVDAGEQCIQSLSGSLQNVISSTHRQRRLAPKKHKGEPNSSAKSQDLLPASQHVGAVSSSDGLSRISHTRQEQLDHPVKKDSDSDIGLRTKAKKNRDLDEAAQALLDLAGAPIVKKPRTKGNSVAASIGNDETLQSANALQYFPPPSLHVAPPFNPDEIVSISRQEQDTLPAQLPYAPPAPWGYPVDPHIQPPVFDHPDHFHPHYPPLPSYIPHPSVMHASHQIPPVPHHFPAYYDSHQMPPAPHHLPTYYHPHQTAPDHLPAYYHPHPAAYYPPPFPVYEPPMELPYQQDRWE